MNCKLKVADNMRPSLGCYKGLDYPGPADEPTVTPNLDGLAREGTLFANAYVQQPFCGPSRYGKLKKVSCFFNCLCVVLYDKRERERDH